MTDEQRNRIALIEPWLEQGREARRLANIAADEIYDILGLSYIIVDKDIFDYSAEELAQLPTDFPKKRKRGAA